MSYQGVRIKKWDEALQEVTPYIKELLTKEYYNPNQKKDVVNSAMNDAWNKAKEGR